MSSHYTEEDVREATRLSCPCGSIAQHDPRQHIECAWAQDLALAVVEHVAPAIAARALREFTTGLMNALAADVREDPAPPLPTQARRDAFVDVARMARRNADEIEGKVK